MILVNIALVGSALVTLAVIWPFILIFYALIVGGFLLNLAKEI